MNLVKAPITLGQQGSNINDLQQAIFWFFQNSYSPPSDLSQLDTFYDEMTKSFYGGATAYMVESLGEQLGFDGSNGINDDAAAKINSLLPSADRPEDNKISGIVTNSNGKPMAGITVTANAVSIRSQYVAGTSVTAADGTFAISYSLSGDTPSQTGLQVVATVAGTDPVMSQIYFTPSSATYVTLTIPVDASVNVADEYTLLYSKISAATSSYFSSLTADDTNFLAGSTGENATMIQMFLLAQIYARETGVGAEAFYGIMRKTSQTSLEVICNMGTDQLTNALQFAVATNIIPHFDTDTISLLVAGVKSAAATIILGDAGKAPEISRSYKILSYVLTTDQISAFLQYYYHNDTDAVDFWDAAVINRTVPSIPLDTATRLQLALTYALISGSNPGMVKQMLTQSTESMAGRNTDYWTTEISAAKAIDFAYPDYITGESESDKMAAYAQSLLLNFDGTYQTSAMHQSIIADAETPFPTLSRNLSAFVTANPSFDLLHTPVSTLRSEDSNFDFGGIDDPDTFVSEVSAMQRLAVVAPSYQTVAALQTAGLSSAMAITQMPQEDFTANFAAAFGSTAAAALTYSNATMTGLIAHAATMNIYQALGNYIPSIYSTPPEASPDWRTLFGNVDFCTCTDCMSVFSPSAYLVDSLELLYKNNKPAYDWLQQKRPDLWNLPLTCGNTNTAMPYIDIVNEILENQVEATGSGYPAITAYDTTLDSTTLRAIPEYIDTNGTAYQNLRDAKYPWTAPYNYFYEQAKEYLALINLKPHRVAQTFSAETDAYTLTDIDLACSYLGITRDNSATSTSGGEYVILTDTNTSSLRTYYGVPAGSYIINPSNRLQQLDTLVLISTSSPRLNRVDIFLQQSGLSYTDLLELLDCYYINKVNSGSVFNDTAVRHLKIDANPETSCDTSLMTITGLTEADLLAIHRFIRLQRRTGWSKYELDRVLQAIGLTAGAAFTNGTLIAIAQIKRMTEIFGCGVDTVLPLWGDFGYMPYSDYSGDSPVRIPTQYELLFRNQAIVPNFQNITGYPFPEDAGAWVQASNPNGLPTIPAAITQSQLDYVLGAFQASENDYDTLFSVLISFLGNSLFTTDLQGKFGFNYHNVRNLWREFTFARLLRLDIKSWCMFRYWMNSIGINPFVQDSVTQFSSALTFIDHIKNIRNSGLNAANIDYLFDDNFATSADRLAQSDSLLTYYKALRTLLSKLNTSVYDTNNNIDAGALLKKIELVLGAADADFMVNVVGKLGVLDAATPYFTSADLSRFKSLLPTELLVPSEGPAFTLIAQLIGTPDINPMNYTVTNTDTRLSMLNDIYTRSMLKVQVRSYMSTTYRTDLAVTDTLLDKWIVTSGKDSYDVLTAESYIKDTNDPDTAMQYTIDVLSVMERFGKAAQIVQIGNLTAADVDFFLENRTIFETQGIPDFANLPTAGAWNTNASPVTPVPIVQWIALLDWLEVNASMRPSPTGLSTIFRNVLSIAPAFSGSRKQAWFNAYVVAVQVNADDLRVLTGKEDDPGQTGWLNIYANAPGPNMPPSYLLASTYKRLDACFSLQGILEVNMNSCTNIALASLYPQDQTYADYVVQAVKAHYSNDTWLSTVQPVSDRLRTGRRDAMVSYLLANPPQVYRQAWVTADDIYDTLLIDTEMMPVVQTSRIKQAISTVQLFIDRCVLQEETIANAATAIQLSADTISQWNAWRKWYRIWEANRKIFVYPENWIEPDLRDDKSPFFQELEKFLKQNEITSDTMEDAYRTYLQRLDEVSHLDVIAYHTEDITDSSNNVIDTIVHVWGRTRSNPHMYYYRNRTGGVWSAWDKMDTQIDGNTFAAVKWHGRLRLYWITLTEQQQKQTSKISVDTEQSHPQKYLKIDLCWTELKNGTWQPKQVGKESVQTEAYGAWTADDFRYYYSNQISTNPGLIWTLPFTVDTFEDSFQYLKDSMMLHIDTNWDGDLEIWIQGAYRYIPMDKITSDLDSRVDKAISFHDFGTDLINMNGGNGQSGGPFSQSGLSNYNGDLSSNFSKYNLSYINSDYTINNAANYNNDYKYNNTNSTIPSQRSTVSQTTVRSLRYLQNNVANASWRSRVGDVIASFFSDDDFRGKANGLYIAAVANNTIPLKSFRGPHFTIKHNKVHASSQWPYTYYSDLFENLNYLGDQGQYDVGPNDAHGYNHIVNRVLSTNTTTTVPLLSQSPSYGVLSDNHQNVKYLVFDRVIPQNNSGSYVPFPKFFYKDYANAFFVEKNTYSISSLLSGGSTGRLLTGTTIKASEIGIESVKLDRTTIPFKSLGTDPGAIPASTGGVSQQQASISYYRFHPFYYYRVDKLTDQLDMYGIDGLFDWDFMLKQSTVDDLNFTGVYKPTSNVQASIPSAYVTNTALDTNAYPTSTLDFRYDSPNAIYNWEMFFHIPLLIATKLMQDQKFTEAMQWFHYVFNPTNIGTSTHGTHAERFWQFYPFYKESLHGIPSITDIMSSPSLINAVQQWADDPFKPHLIARTRISAYMKNVLMKYLDNLIAWGDQLFRRETLEEINEATLLYILAAKLLGKAPVKIPARVASEDLTYADLKSSPNVMNAFSNALVNVETLLAPTGMNQTYVQSPKQPLQMYYFCIPKNDKLLSYWDVVADRLFKIRNSENIDGVERQLALFEPPIDPALLVRATALGISLSDAVNELLAPLPQYRFNVISQKATELAQEVKSLGASLLSAIEKKDAEHISLLRSSQEISVLDAAKAVRQMQIQEAQAQVAGLEEQQNMVTIRRDYYQNLINTGLNEYEQSQLDSLQKSLPLRVSQGAFQTLAGIMHIIPNIKLGSPFTLGTTEGGQNLGNVMEAAAGAVGVASTINDIQGSMAGTKAGHVRRSEEWQQQLTMANAELAQIDKQMVAAQIREAIAEQELANHNLQYQNAIALDQAMHDKYSNEDLYDWMIGQISLTYFQSYKLAFDLAKRAERCFAFEIGVELDIPFIQFGYWDSLKKGLLAGEALIYDIKRMDAAYLDQNKRLHEMTKHISLAALDANALLELKSGGKPTINLPEWLFDMDYPGHYMRRIKSVSLSIPCVAGPYTTISAKLTLVSSKYRKNTILNPSSGSTPSDPYAEAPVGNDVARFVYTSGGSESIATSSAQNDSGMFEMNFRDERYLPFEGAGAISTWTLELPSKYASFDIDSISDVIFHVHYTAKYDASLTTPANDRIGELIDAATGNAILPRLFSLKHEFASEWYAYAESLQNGSAISRMTFTVSQDYLPLFCKNKKATITDLYFKPGTDTALSDSYKVYFTYQSGTVETTLSATLDSNNKYTGHITITGTDPVFCINGNTKILKVKIVKVNGSTETAVNMDTSFNDLYMVAMYQLENSLTPDPDDIDLGDMPVNDMRSWWKADTGLSVSGGHVTQWTDATGNGFDLTALSNLALPVQTTDTNGLPVVQFTNAALAGSGNPISDTDNYTIFYVGSSNVSRGLDSYGSGWSVAVFDKAPGTTDVATSVVFVQNGALGYTISTPTPSAAPVITAVTMNQSGASSVVTLYGKNGTVLNTENIANKLLRTSTLGTVMGVTYNSSIFVNGITYEAIVYNRVLSNTEINLVMSYLRTRYPNL
ncbi:neuraminidase-like domain-containing protein [Chitinophagaceae bacterium MMS25-I14]